MRRASGSPGSTVKRLKMPVVTVSGLGESRGAVTVPYIPAACPDPATRPPRASGTRGGGDAEPAPPPPPPPRLVARDGARDEEALHPLRELHPQGPRRRPEPHGRGQRVVDRPVTCAGKEGGVALRERRDREKRVHADRARHDGAVGDVEPLGDRRAGRPGVDLALVIDDAVLRSVGHDAAAERMDGDEAVVERLRPDRVLDPLAAGGARRRSGGPAGATGGPGGGG